MCIRDRIYTDDVDKVETRVLHGASTTHQLLPLGGDQRYVDFNLQERLSFYNERSTHDIQYFESDLESFFKELREEDGLPQITGEFIDASVSDVYKRQKQLLTEQGLRRLLCRQQTGR